LIIEEVLLMPKHDIVVIGASAGGIQALKAILSDLPKDLPASIFVTLHTAPTGEGYLADILAGISLLPVGLAIDKEKIAHGRVYVAAPNLHLTVKRGYVKNRFMPKENVARPAIDPMFRSAAHSYSRRVIGVLLTGRLDDGTAGLGVIQDEGGITIVQDPKDAEYADMPLSAIRNINPDHIVPLAEIAPILVTLVNTEVTGEAPTDETETNDLQQVMTCPGCGGILHQYVNKRVIWYQCQVGHRFTSETMMLEQNSIVEEHFWRLLSLLKEKEELARTMVVDARSTLNPLVNPEYFIRQAEASAEAQKRISDLLDEFGSALFPGISQKDIYKTPESNGE
jgi:two-component system chemotaxis response regulator CheB